jgi:hypothetical protein
LNATFAMQRTGASARRGRDLGLLNLANTVPALAGAALTWALVTPHDFAAAMWVLAATMTLGGAVTMLIRE